MLRGVVRPRFAKHFRRSETGGRGECRVPNAPAAWCAHIGSESMHTSIHSGSTGIARHPPRSGVTASFALSPGTIGGVDPVDPLVPRLAARLGSARFHQNLDADHGAPEPRDFSVRNNAARPARSRSLTSCLALRPHAHTAPSRPPHPAPRFVTIGRNAPLHRGGISETMLLICPTRQAREDATEWHDGQIAYGAHARSARRAS